MAIDDFELTLDSTEKTTTKKPRIIDAVSSTTVADDDLQLETAPVGNNELVPVEEDNSPSAVAVALEKSFDEKQMAQVAKFYPTIPIMEDPNLSITYATSEQNQLGEFSEKILKQTRTTQLGTAGDMLAALVANLENLTPENKIPKANSIFIKQKVKKYFKYVLAHYDDVASNVERVSTDLKNHIIVLRNDQKTLADFDELIQVYIRKLAMYIVAGSKRLQEVRENELAELRILAQQDPSSDEALKYDALEEACNSFENKLHDLALTRNVAIQTCLQGRVISKNNRVLIAKITSTIANTIPLWKNQMVISLNLANSMSALEAQRKATDMTNQLLRENAERLHAGSIAIAKENERGIVDLETLVHTNQKLIATVTEVQQIQADGRKQRRDAEVQLVALEKDLKDKLSRTVK